MKLLSINLENFRNIEAASLNFYSRRVFFIGSNGQGKTNLLEAIGLSSNLRSFRKAGTDGLVMGGKNESRLFFKFEDETLETAEILFGFKLKVGNSKNVLTKPYTIVLSESMVDKYFGDKNPLYKKVFFSFITLFIFKTSTGVSINVCENPANNGIKID